MLPGAFSAYNMKALCKPAIQQFYEKVDRDKKEFITNKKKMSEIERE